MAATKAKVKQKAITGALAHAREVGRLPATRLWLAYDAEVLYVSLHRPQKATETVEDDDNGVLLHYRNQKLVGITVLEASKR